MRHKLRPSAQQRLQKAKQTWGGTRKTIFTNHILTERTRKMLWNALIRSTLTYALHTQEYAEIEIRKAEQFQNKCLRQIKNEKWFLQEK